MATTVQRKIITIDQEKCNGCGDCVTACHEGAIQIIDGKAGLIRDDYCDGLGDCLGECPQDAISFEVRDAAPYDDDAVQAHLKRLRPEYDRDGTKTPDCADLIARVDAAEARAERQLARRVAERTPHGPPSTTVGLLTREIRQAAERAR